MLAELTIQDFAIIDELHLRFSPGFNVLTGETGAGKSIILDATTLVIGGRADATMIRAGCEQAYVEAAFRLSPAMRQSLLPLLEAEGLEGEEDDLLLLARELRANGRNICRVNGRAVTLSLLRELGDQLVDIHGQGEHLSLLQPRSHLPLLDAYAGLTGEQKEVAREASRLQALRQELRRLRQDERAISQRIDLLKFQVEEIDAASLKEGEEEALEAEGARLANVEHLTRYTAEALDQIAGLDDESASALDLLNQAERTLNHLARLDETRAGLLERLQGLTFQVDELANELRHYQEELEFNPGRLSFVEERLALIHRLKRKYGDDIGAILAWRDKAAAELAQLDQSEERIEELQILEEEALRRVGRMASALSEKRQLAARQLAEAVERELADLSMAGAVFQPHFTLEPDEQGVYVGERRLAFDRMGIDRMEFLVSANPGEPPKPLSRVASGGETSRLMLALKTVLAQVDATTTLIFDEIDQGIGGRVGNVVGQKLWGLTAGGRHQVIVVTHLPQLAGYGDSHYHVSKRALDSRTATRVKNLDLPGRVEELAAMLGAQGEPARKSAEVILQRAMAAKNN